MNKKKVLFITESHHLASGFGTYAKEVLSRLSATNKYELAEFASYGSPDSLTDLAWKYYSNTPSGEEQKKKYEANPLNTFGLWRFNHVLLDFRPDIVITYRDPWMDDWVRHSPLRKNFHWAWMPTVDSYPQKQSWIETFKNCDGILTYSEFGTEVLQKQSNGTINVYDCASPGINPEIYAPVKDKKTHKKSFSIPEDCYIVGTVMRNQTRKLFIELMKSFRIFLDTAPKEISDKTYLYLHTSYPEKTGWNIEEGIIENNLLSKVICTYVCRSCDKWYPSKYKGPITTCKYCSHRTAFMPNVGHGVTSEQLVDIYNFFDLYVQYAICEGFGMPQVEAASCGVPVAATDYSAMSDVIKHTKGFPIKIKNMFRDIGTNADRAYPDNEHLAKIMEDYLALDEDSRKEKSRQARNGAVARYNWDDTAKVWENYIDSYLPSDEQGLWDSPAKIGAVPKEPIQTPSNAEFVKWCYTNILNKPEKVNSFEALTYCSNLDFGCQLTSTLDQFNREIMFKRFSDMAEERNMLESVRIGQTPMNPVDFLKEPCND